MADVMLCDDQQLSRSALAALLDSRGEFTVVGAVDDPVRALEFVEQHQPDVVVMSLENGDEGTIATAAKISGMPGCRSLLLATSFPRSVVRRAFTGGVDGMIQRNAAPDQFFDAIERVSRGERVFDAEMTVAALGYGTVGGDEECPLTVREFAVLEYVARGDSVPEIAAFLCLSEGTVRNYMTSIVSKLGARNRIDAVRMARESNWI